MSKKSCKEKEKTQGRGTSTVRMDVNNKLKYTHTGEENWKNGGRGGKMETTEKTT